MFQWYIFTFRSNIKPFLLKLILLIGFESIAVVPLLEIGGLKLNRAFEFLWILNFRFLSTLKRTMSIFKNARRNVIKPLVGLSFFELFKGRCFNLGVNSFETGFIVALI